MNRSDLNISLPFLLVLRQPIIAVLGHVDHGKTSLLDRIRKTTVHQKEAGGITQHIGATEVPVDVIREITRPIAERINVSFRIPGLLFIDTPGHEAFTHLRKRGGSIADMAVLVVDVREGFKPQTYEAVEILREFRTPFIVAANKVDLLHGWIPCEDCPITESLKRQRDDVMRELDERIYRIVGELSTFGISSERFDRVTDFTREVVIIPVSAKTGEGIPELLLYLAGLTQKYLEKRLESEADKPGKGVILEVREEPGMGKTLNVILYEGRMRKGDTVTFMGKSGVKTGKIRAIFRPKPLDEIRSPRNPFTPVEEVVAAAGVKLLVTESEDALAGSPIFVGYHPEAVKTEYSFEYEKHEVGVIVKADTLGSLEALVGMLSRRGIPVRRAEVGDVHRKDVIEASAVREKDRYRGVILAFNVKVDPDAREEAERRKVPVIEDAVIYRLLDKYEQFLKEEREREKRETIEKLIVPAKIKILPGYVFRRSNPAIVGVKVLDGVIRVGYPLMRDDGKTIGVIKGIQVEGRPKEVAERGEEVAVAIEGPMVGRQIDEGDVLYTDVPPEHLRIVKAKRNLLPVGDVLREVEEILRYKLFARKDVS